MALRSLSSSFRLNGFASRLSRTTMIASSSPHRLGVTSLSGLKNFSTEPKAPETPPPKRFSLGEKEPKKSLMTTLFGASRQREKEKNEKDEQERQTEIEEKEELDPVERRNRQMVIMFVAFLLLGVIMLDKSLDAEETDESEEEKQKRKEKELKEKVENAGKRRPDLPDFTAQQVAAHASVSSGGIWVIFREGVYDISEFVGQHPGGKDKIMMAAGSSIEPFWELYSVHLQQEEPLDFLEAMRIGNLDPEDVKKGIEDQKKRAMSSGGLYENDPKRNPVLKVVAPAPFNAETPLPLLVSSFLTANNLFFVRNHLPVPVVNPETFRLEIRVPRGDGQDDFVVSLSLDDLQHNFPVHEVISVIQCAGNRRSDFQKPARGLQWTQGAIGNAKWKGVYLRDLLEHAGLKAEIVEERGVKHVQFEGLDQDGQGQHYGASIPVEKAISRQGEVLVAFEMNDEPLPRDHGFPLRVIVPGVVGARNVKWLSKIIASSEESPSFWQQQDYKVYSPSVDWNDLAGSSTIKSKAIQDLPVQSGICEPTNGAIFGREDDTLFVRGYAWSGGGRAIERVDVTIDGGQTWHPTSLVQDKKQTEGSYQRSWAWTLWEASVPVPESLLAQVENMGSSPVPLEIAARAVDSACNSQPERDSSVWNMRGLSNNSWHRVHVSFRPPRSSP